MSTITVRAEITKNRKRGWSCWTYVQYPDWPNEAVTGDGDVTLGSTLWHLVLTCMDWESALTTVHVKDKLMPKSEIYQRVHQSLAGGAMSYKLPAIREYLLEEVTNEL